MKVKVKVKAKNKLRTSETETEREGKGVKIHRKNLPQEVDIVPAIHQTTPPIQLVIHSSLLSNKYIHIMNKSDFRHFNFKYQKNDRPLLKGKINPQHKKERYRKYLGAIYGCSVPSTTTCWNIHFFFLFTKLMRASIWWEKMKSRLSIMKKDWHLCQPNIAAYLL